MEVVKTYKVDITISANTSKYWARIAFIDKKGVLHQRELEVERQASKNSNHLQAIIDAIQILNRPCMLDIYTSSEYIIEPLKQGWIRNWEQHSWTNAKGNVVRNAEQWQQVKALLAPHSARFLYINGRG